MFPHLMCPFDEILTLLLMIPFIGVVFKKLHAWYHTKIKHKEH
jgi:hypothetical protein